MRKHLTFLIVGVFMTLSWAATAGAQTTTVNFDAPPPPGSSSSLLQGVFQGIDFGTGRWRWEGPYDVDATNHIFFDSSAGASRTFAFSPAPRRLDSVRVFAVTAGTLTLSDDLGQALTRTVPTGSMQLVTTGWTRASTVVTVAFTAGWDFGLDDITYTSAGAADTTPPSASVTAPPDGATLSGTVTVSAQASDDVGVAGVQFLLNGVNLGGEDTAAPYAVSWDTTGVPNGPYTLTAAARDAAGNRTTSSPVRVTVSNGQAGGTAGYALRFYGNGVGDIDRVKIRVDDPATFAPGPPADIGATDFTVEFWLRALASENPAPAVQCGANYDWIFGHAVVDRDRFSQDRAFGLSIAGDVIVFGVRGEGSDVRTICGTSSVLDDRWHHVAVQRRRADGWLWLFVDGRLEAEADGPDGDISYPDLGIPGNFCGGPCVDSDPYLVLGAEKHDVGPQFPSFAGWLDEVRLSNVLRYPVDFTRPSAPFVSDLNTVALYHFDEGSGDVIRDTSGAPGGPSDGTRRPGGTPPGPEWVLSDAPLGIPVEPPPPPPGPPPPGGLVAAYAFNEGSGPTVTDASGNGNTGTVSGAAWTSLGRFGGALVFNGANAWVTVNDSASLDLSAGMTLEAWVYSTASPTEWRAVIAKEGSGTTMAYFLHASSSPGNRPATGLTSGGTEQVLAGGAPLAANTWTHLAATYDGSAQRLYVNGEQVAVRAQTGAVVGTTGPLRIGGDGIWGEYFQGRIDEVRIYNRALTQAEIQGDLATPVSP